MYQARWPTPSTVCFCFCSVNNFSRVFFFQRGQTQARPAKLLAKRGAALAILPVCVQSSYCTVASRRPSLVRRGFEEPIIIGRACQAI